MRESHAEELLTVAWVIAASVVPTAPAMLACCVMAVVACWNTICALWKEKENGRG